MAFIAIGIRRDQVPVYAVERTGDERMLLAWPDSCDQDPHVRVVETDASVTVTATRNRHFCGGTGGCAESVEFTLQEPLGDRVVFDGDRHVPIPVRDPL